MSTLQNVSQDYLRQCFREENGQLFWLRRPRWHFCSDRVWKLCNTRWADKEAGCITESSPGEFRWRIILNNKRVYRASLVFAMYTGRFIKNLDHKNGRSLDDQIGNLREATGSQQSANSRLGSNNTSGYRGVSWDKKRRMWVAYITHRNHHIWLGCFADPQEAHAAYMAAARDKYGEFACSGVRTTD